MKKGGIFFGIPLLFIGAILSFQVFAAEVQLNLCIGRGVVSIEAPQSLDFGSKEASNQDQIINLDFQTLGVGLVLEDLKGDRGGYYATLSVSDLIDVTHTGNIIDSNNATISFEGRDIQRLNGNYTSEVSIPQGLTSAGAGFNNFTDAITILQRSTDVFGRTGRFQVQPLLRILLPAYQSVGAYRGTITYTVIDTGVESDNGCNGANLLSGASGGQNNNLGICTIDSSTFPCELN